MRVLFAKLYDLPGIQAAVCARVAWEPRLTGRNVLDGCILAVSNAPTRLVRTSSSLGVESLPAALDAGRRNASKCNFASLSAPLDAFVQVVLKN